MSQQKKLKRKQIGYIVAGLVVIVILVFVGITISSSGKRPISPAEKRKTEKITAKKFSLDSKHVVSEKDRWIEQSEESIAGLRNDNERLQRRLDETLKRISSIEKSGKDKKPKAQETPEFSDSLPSNLGSLGLPPPPIRPPESSTKVETPKLIELPKTTVPAQEIKVSEEKIQVINLSDEKKPVEKNPKNISRYIPTGSFAKAALLSGVDAPTGGQAQSNPMPILMRIVDRGILPNFADTPIRNCHVTGAAYGDISSERALIRIEALSCVLENGDVIETPVKGYVAGEDGKSGLRGRIVSKQGSMIAKSAMAGVFSGMGNSIASQYQKVSSTALGPVTSIDPERAGEAGLANGTSSALDKIADYYLARANETYPIIEIDANRIGEIVLTAGVDLGTDIVGKIKEKR